MTETSLTEELYELVEYEAASPEVQKIYDETKKELGLPFVLNWFKCQGNNPVLLKGNWEKLRSTLLQGEVPQLLKQLIIYNVSAKRDVLIARERMQFLQKRWEKQLVDPDFAVAEDLEEIPVSNTYITAIKIVTRAALKPFSIANEDFEELYDAGFTVPEIRELMSQADLVNMLNTIADVSKIKIDNELLEIEG